ncbi:hypothetical protein AB3N59_07420 [Leptospira sp. WS92.C1]
MLNLLLLTSYVFFASMTLAYGINKKNRSIFYLLITSYLLFITQISTSVLLFGVFGPYLTAFNLFIFNGVFSSAIFFFYRKDLPALYRLFQDRIVRWRKNKTSLFRNLEKILSLVFIIELLILFGKVYFFPNYVWDEMVYHLHPIVSWYQEHQILTQIETPNYWVNSEILGPKLFAFWFVVFLENDALLNSTQFFSAILLFLLSYRFLRLQNLNSFLSICGALIVFHIPMVLIQTQTNQDHITLVSYAFASIFFIYEFILKRKSVSIVFLGISLGLLLSSKTVAVMYVFVILLAFLVYFLIYEKYQNKLLLQIALFIGIASVISGYWYLKNFEELLDLIFSMSKSATGKTESAGLLSSILKLFRSHLSIFLINLGEFPSRILDFKTNEYQADSTNMSSFGIQFFSLGLIGYLFALVRFPFSKKKKDRLLFTIVLISLAIQFLYFTFYLTPWNYRLFQLTSIFGILFGMTLIARLRFKKKLVFAFTIFILGFNFFTTLFADYSEPFRMKDFVMNFESNERSVMNYYNQMGSGSWAFLNQYVPEEEPIAYVASFDTWIYPYFGTKFKRKIHYIEPKNYKVIDGKILFGKELLDSLKKRGVRFFHLKKDNFTYWNVENKNLVRVVEGVYFLDVSE